MTTRKELAERLEAHEARGTVYLGDGRGAPLKVSELKAALLEADAEIERLIGVCKEHKLQNDAHQSVIADLEKKIASLKRTWPACRHSDQSDCALFNPNHRERV